MFVYYESPATDSVKLDFSNVLLNYQAYQGQRSFPAVLGIRVSSGLDYQPLLEKGARAPSTKTGLAGIPAQVSSSSQRTILVLIKRLEMEPTKEHNQRRKKIQSLHSNLSLAIKTEEFLASTW